MRRRRVPRPAGRPDPWTSGDDPPASPFTIEGQIQQYGQLAQGINRARGWRRGLGKGCMIAMLLFLVAGAIVPLVLIVLVLA